MRVNVILAAGLLLTVSHCSFIRKEAVIGERSDFPPSIELIGDDSPSCMTWQQCSSASPAYCGHISNGKQIGRSSSMMAGIGGAVVDELMS